MSRNLWKDPRNWEVYLLKVWREEEAGLDLAED
jgi:hypothetical protein